MKIGVALLAAPALWPGCTVVTSAQQAQPNIPARMTGDSLDAANHVGQPPQVTIKEIPMGNAPKIIPVAPISINVYRFPLAAQ